MEDEFLRDPVTLTMLTKVHDETGHPVLSAVVTPMTYVRYTGNWKGTFMTWILNSDNAKCFRLVKKTVPGLDNFWLSGMWVMPPGGLPTAVKTSRDIIQMICRKSGKSFRATPALLAPP